MVSPREISQGRIASEPEVVWNEFIGILAMSSYEELSPTQRGAHLVFWYESEVQNGGHFQYITNRGLAHLDELISALTDMGAKCQSRLMIEVKERLAASTKPKGQAEDEWADDVLGEDVYERLDMTFGDCSPDLMEVLEKHLDTHEAEFIRRIND